MIKLEVEDYCHKCNHFKPCLSSFPTNLYANNTLAEVLGDYVVSCANKDLCDDLYLRARKQQLDEKGKRELDNA